MGTGEILIVDDNEVLQRTMRSVLETFGLRVRLASSGEEALAWLRSGGAPQAVITDHLMDGMTGLELLAHVGQLAPSAFQVLHTGLSSVEVSVRPGSALTVLAKPSPVALLRRLASVATSR